jgi:hypothetical protein
MFIKHIPVPYPCGAAFAVQIVFPDDLSMLPITSHYCMAAWYQMSDGLRIYSKLDNLTDEANIVSRRPFGARPGKPRQFVLGAKYSF